ncbi:MAG: DCC1-like thiol-disulfide oxidoreductase family protein [Planctomycetota bacterium]
MSEPDTLYYDGDCGLCHGTVKFVAKRDRDGSRFIYTPLQGDLIQQRLDAQVIAGLPDSIVVQRSVDGVLLMKSDAVAYILDRLPGVWPTLGAGLRVIPRALRDFGYGCVARVRKRIFSKPDGPCPMLPPEWRGRFKG